MAKKFLAATAACVALVCAIWLPSASGQQVVPERPKSFEWVCCVQIACEDDDGPFPPVTGNPHPDIDVAWQNVLAACQDAMSGHPNCECCVIDPPNICEFTNNKMEDCTDIPTFLKPITARKTDKYEARTFTIPVSTAVMRYEIEGVSKIGHKRYALATTAGAMRAAQLFINGRIKDHGGAVAGSVRLRTVPHFLYRCYLRVRSRDGIVRRNDEVEGQGETQEIAFQNALVAVDMLIEANEFKNVRLLPGARFTRAENWCVAGDIFKRVQRAEACQQTVLCQYTCLTANGTHIAVTRHGETQDIACNIAEVAALEFADQFGGATDECEQTGVFPETLARVACATCSGDAAKTADAENTNAAQTNAANAPSVLEQKTP